MHILSFITPQENLFYKYEKIKRPIPVDLIQKSGFISYNRLSCHNESKFVLLLFLLNLSYA